MTYEPTYDPWYPPQIGTIQQPETQVATYPAETPLGQWQFQWQPGGTAGSRMIGVPICPDLLDYDALGEADNWRGRVVRAFFWLLARLDAIMGRWQ